MIHFNPQRDMRQTSLEAYEDIKPDLGQRQQDIFDFLLKSAREGEGPYTDWEITKLMGESVPNRVRPRRVELWHLGYVSDYGTRKCTVTGRRAHVWGVSPWRVL